MVTAAIALLEQLGAEVTEVSLPMFPDSQAISGTILMAEAAAYHRELLAKDGDKLDPAVRLRLEAGLFVTAADYLKAQQARARFNREMAALFQEVDLLAGPAEPITAPPILAAEVDINGQTVGTTGGFDSIHPALQHQRLPGHIVALRLFRPAECPSACSWPGNPLPRPRCCRRPMPMNRLPTGIPAARRFSV